MSGFLSPYELKGLRRLADGGFVTPVEILRSVALTKDPDSMDYDPAYDYGDDDLSDQNLKPNPLLSTKAWFYSTLQNDVGEDEGQVGTIDLHQIRMAVGVDVRPHDVVRRTDTNEEFVVVDTNAEDTFADMLRLTARRRE